MTNELIPVADAVIVRRENITAIAQAGPKSYEDNSLSCTRCLQAGENLLAEIERKGMSDELDARLAAYIEKSRKTLKVMNERRAPVTKLFDQVRSEFTLLENAVNPAAKDSIPARIQQARNAYAAARREEEKRRREEEIARQEEIKTRALYRTDVEQALRNIFSRHLDEAINQISQINAAITLDNWEASVTTLRNLDCQLGDWKPTIDTRKPHTLTGEEALAIRKEIFEKLLPDFRKQYGFEVTDYRDEMLDRLPAKKEELEHTARLDAEEAARRKAEMARRDAEEARRKEEERRKAEADERRKAEADRANAEVVGLFGMAKADRDASPRAKVTKKIRVDDPQAFLSIVSLWWQHEGCRLSADELSKIFRRQTTFCEKLANKEGIFADTPGLTYIDEVKAR